ncbi:MAG: hypothetical protein BJ554DRAFT_5833, partial [Olpidium bornovanus]
PEKIGHVFTRDTLLSAAAAAAVDATGEDLRAAAVRPGRQLVPSLDETFKRNTRSRSKQQLAEQQAAIVTERLFRASLSESAASALPISFGTTIDVPNTTPAALLAPQGTPFPGRFPTGETPSATSDQGDTQSVFAPCRGRPREQFVNDDDAVGVSLSHDHQRPLFGRTPQYERGQYENEAAMARKVGSEYEGNDRFGGASGGGVSLDTSPSAPPTDPHRFISARNQGNVVENRGTVPRPDTMQDFVPQCLPHTPRYTTGFEPYPNGAPYPKQGIPGTYYAMPQWYATMPGVTPASLDPNCAHEATCELQERPHKQEKHRSMGPSTSSYIRALRMTTTTTGRITRAGRTTQGNQSRRSHHALVCPITRIGTSDDSDRDNQTKKMKYYHQADSDWAGDQADRRSRTGFVLLFGLALIVWKAQKQPCIALSFCEAEYIAASCAAACLALTSPGRNARPHSRRQTATFNRAH